MWERGRLEHGLESMERAFEIREPGLLFLRVAPSVVVIRAQGRDVSSPASGLTYFSEVGSGVLVSNDGKVMTAAHVVHAMDEISVEFLGEQPVKARVVASEPAADLSLLQLDRVPPNAVPARQATPASSSSRSASSRLARPGPAMFGKA